MITNRHRMIVVLAASIFPAAAISACAYAEQVQVTVEVVTSDGTPITDAPVLVHTLADMDFGFTSAQGQLQVTTTLAKDNRTVVARIWDGSRINLPTWEEQDFASQREKALKQQYFLPLTVEASVPENQSACTVQILAWPAVTIHGRFVDAAGVPLTEWFVSARGGASGAGSWPNEVEGPFALGGVRRNAETELWANTDSSQVHIYPLSLEQTQADSNLGDLVLSDVDAPIQTNILLVNYAELLGPGELPWYRTVTAIRSDGQVIYCFSIGFDGRAVETRTAEPEDGVGGRLAPGVYYLAPGLFGAEMHWLLLDAIREDRLDELNAAGVPRITAVEGEVAAATVDMRAARDAIMTVIGD